MRFRPHRFLRAMRFAQGRRHLLVQAGREAWPIVSRVAALYRRIATPQCKICAVIGSLGKSTTTRAIRCALGLPVGRHDWGNALGAIIANMAQRPGFRERLVMEVGIEHMGQMARYAWMLQPDMAVVTCVASEHHRSFGTLAVTRREKSEMLRVLPPSGLAVLNGDDPNVLWMGQHTRARIVTCGFGPENDFRAEDYELEWPRGIAFTARTDGWSRRHHVNLIGRHMTFPILAGLAVARELGVPLDTAAPRMEQISPVLGRLQPVPLPNGAWILRDDFKSTYETIRSALDILAQLPAPRRFVVLGDVSEPPGSQGPVYRSIGRRVAGIAQRFYVIGHSRQRYAAGAVRAGMPRESIIKAGFNFHFVARDLQRRLGPGDVVLIKGRGDQQMERIVLAMEGADVRCTLERCMKGGVPCERCADLSREPQVLHH